MSKPSFSERTGVDWVESGWRILVLAPLFLAGAFNNMLAALLYLAGVVIGSAWWNHGQSEEVVDDHPAETA